MIASARSYLQPANTAAVMAAVLLLALSWTGWNVVQQVLLIPSAVPPATVAASRTANADPQERQRATTLASGPRWGELTPEQREVLDQLEERWPMMGAVQKRRWMALADGYDKLSPREQHKFHSRMNDWSNLSAQQRNQARLNFALTKQLATDKQAQWEAYLALSEEEKRLLAARAAPKVVTAAPANKPSPSKKLTRIPAATTTPSTLPNLPKIPPAAISLPPSVPLLPLPNVEGTVPRPPTTVETAPIHIPSAAPVSLPPMEGENNHGSSADSNREAPATSSRNDGGE